MTSPQPGPSKHKCTEISENRDNFDVNKNHSKRQKVYVIDDSGMKFEGNMNISYGEIKTENDTSMFEEEEGESDEELEYGELDEFFEDAEDTGEWMCNGDFKQFSNEKIASFNVPSKGLEPCNFFELLLDENFFSMITTESNKYAEIRKDSRWKILTVTEFRKFLGLMLHMGTVKCSKIENYWSTHRLFNFNCFSRHMSRNRFQEILRSLHFTSSNEIVSHMDNIQPIIDYFNNKMKAIYCPHKELSMAETMIPWRGRLEFRQYIAGEKYKYGVKLYVLTESSGIALRIKMCSENEEEVGGKENATKVVLRLLEDFLQRGHSVFIENFNTSFTLNDHPFDGKSHCAGTFKKFKKANDDEHGTSKLSKSEMISRNKNKIMMSRYTCSRRTFKWYIKLWINVVETLLLNSFLLYSKYSPCNRKLNFYEFRINIIDILLFNNDHENVLEVLPELEHTPDILPRGKNNKIQRKKCRHCFSHNIRKETNYYCGACEGKPGLCIGKCFKEYHKHK